MVELSGKLAGITTNYAESWLKLKYSPSVVCWSEKAAKILIQCHSGDLALVEQSCIVVYAS